MTSKLKVLLLLLLLSKDSLINILVREKFALLGYFVEFSHYSTSQFLF